MVTERTDRAWFSRLLRHPARKRSWSCLITPEPARDEYAQPVINQPRISVSVRIRAMQVSHIYTISQTVMTTGTQQTNDFRLTVTGNSKKTYQAFQQCKRRRSAF